MKKILVAVLMLVGLSASFVAMADGQPQQDQKSNIQACVDNIC